MAFDYNRPQSVGRVRAFYGNFGMFIRALAYIFANGPGWAAPDHRRRRPQRELHPQGLEGVYDLPYDTRRCTKSSSANKIQSKKGVKTMDLAKRLIDYGFPSVYDRRSADRIPAH